VSLWFKAWCETRSRVVVAVIALAIVSIGLVGWSAHWSTAGEAPQTIFLVLATVLGGGSLRQERAVGTLGFTLALPVSRDRHLAVRVVVGIGEIVALAGLVAALTRTPQVLPLWGACGSLAFVIALGFSTVIANEYSAWLASFGIVMLYETTINLVVRGGDPRFDVYRIMGDGLVEGPLPWSSLGGVIAIGVIVVGLATLALRRQGL
jgi:hypothetical protein